MNKWKVMLSAVVIASALAGCGVQEEQAGAEVQADAQADVQQNGAGAGDGTQQQGGGRQGMGQMGAQADLMGKIKSVDGQTITLYKSAMGQGGPPQGEGTEGAPPEGEGQQPPAAGEMPADGERPEGGGRMGGMGAMFSDETVVITVTDTTKITSVTFENEQMVETEVALADLKADDILSVMLKDDTQEAESITIRTSGFGGGGRQPQQEEQTATAV
ncbi:hypothetical protein FHS16_000819 [Paenibacillus endophyticus]|uniref:DUF5666 domain-containing protein n=1 Tax=Paenibacillus endophyticus TaxID=1294268 RepID=A0A7W5C412_9BACL|nr:hypothetical protein [Paenibacillus endophyticus]MBB3150785.1 hypothetical protein [Paenibacillus endophyticus]